jgi:hypothetical protein
MKVSNQPPAYQQDTEGDIIQLNSIDNMRVDGKFYMGNDIPEGQGSVNALLAECYDIVWELRAAVPDEEERTSA